MYHLGYLAQKNYRVCMYLHEAIVGSAIRILSWGSDAPLVTGVYIWDETQFSAFIDVTLTEFAFAEYQPPTLLL